MTYIPYEQATSLRIFFEDGHWWIDAVDDDGVYTEGVWDWDAEANDSINTKERALQLAQAYAKEYAPHLVGTIPRVLDVDGQPMESKLPENPGVGRRETVF